MTEKRFSIWDCNSMENILNTFIQDKEKEGQENTLLTHKECCNLLNTLYEENEQLKKELKYWKYNYSSFINENSILWNEIAIMREQGAKPSSAFEEYCSKFKGDVNE